MTSTTPAPQELTLSREQSQLAENLAKVDRAQARRQAKAAPLPPSKAVTLEDHIFEATDDILRVSAGLQSFLTLLELQSDPIPKASASTPCLPLKQQLVDTADRLQATGLTRESLLTRQTDEQR